MGLTFWIAIFLLSLAVLIKSADYFTDFAEKFGLALEIPQFVVGVTIVSIGTSLPELASSLASAIKGDTEIVVANVIGSNIANILLIIGIASIVAGGIKVKRNIVDLDLPLLAGGGIILFLITFWDNEVTFVEGILALVTYFIYLRYLLSLNRNGRKKSKDNKKKISYKIILGILISAGFVAFSANYLIESVVKISSILDIGKGIIAMSAIAIGTSLPELFVSIAAARKGNYEVAIGNVFGSNIFNGCVAVGLPALFSNLKVSAMTSGIAIPFFIIATLIFIVSGFTQKIYSWEGWLYVVIYIMFIGKIFNLF